MRSVSTLAVAAVAAAEYKTYEGKTCWNGHGAVEIDSDSTAPVGLDEDGCEEHCDEDAQCDCVAFQPSNGKCWKRKDCVPDQFGADSQYKVFVKTSDPTPSPPTPSPPTPSPSPGLGYMTYEGKTCWNGHGAVEIDDDSSAPVGLDDESCEARCDDDADCDCVAFQPSTGKCWKRKECVPYQFGADSQYKVFVKVRPSTTPPPPTPPPPAITPITWDEAWTKAQNMVGQMQSDEKFKLMRGTGYGHWHFVGSTDGISRVGIPNILMQDAAGGFRTTEEGLVGTVTCWPSLLSMAATWDTAMMFDFAEALGFEFASKGANMILGPSINVHRMGWNGRNFEYLSGEDPYLGAMLTKEYVKGVQGQSVMATMKHFPFNHEESHRNNYNVIIDDKTAWELYYPPYQAAVDAGVVATMCSYNREDGPNSCGNGQRLNQDLKMTMGYKGFIQSDWGATHGTSVDQGLDQDMPGDDHWYDDSKLYNVDGDLIDDSATRVLAALYKLDLVDNVRCDPTSGCDDMFFSDVRTGHSELALAAATESIVLLKNKEVLPFADSVKTIAVVGNAADAAPYDSNHGSWAVGDFYSGGGSGHVTAGHLTTPLQGIQLRAMQAGIDVLVSASDDVGSAVDVAQQADVTIIVAGTSSSESYDRDHLDLDGDMDNFVPKVAAASKKTVVLTEIPGQTLMSWRDSADAIATNFLAGEETGKAWAKVLFGDHSPTGKLPIMIPDSESDTIRPADTTGDIEYTEGMRTSYRNTDLNAAFPFGHGLSYTTFDFGEASAGDCDGELCVKLTITNTGSVEAKTVVQLYLEFPEEAKHPTPLLKGFTKTGLLQPGDAEEVSIQLSERYSLTYWEDGQWIKPSSVTAHIGASSADILQTLDLNLDSKDQVVV